MEPSFIQLSAEQQNEWKSLCPLNHYKSVQQKDLPSSIPDSLRAKCHSATIIVSGSPCEKWVCHFANLKRLDGEYIDEEAFGFVVIDNRTTSGMFLHHGSWQDRTIKCPNGFIENLNASGIGAFFCPNLHSRPPEGKTEDLRPDSDSSAFAEFLEAARKHLTY